MVNCKILVIGDGLAARYLINILNKKFFKTLQIVPVGKINSELTYIDESNKNIFTNQRFISGYSALGGRSIKWGGQLSLPNKIKTKIGADFIDSLPNYPSRKVIKAWLSYSKKNMNGVLLVKPKKFYQSLKKETYLNERIYANISDIKISNLTNILKENSKNSDLDSYEKIFGCIGSLGNLKFINSNPFSLTFNDHIYYCLKNDKLNKNCFCPKDDYVQCEGKLLRIEKIVQFENTELSIRRVNSFGKSNKSYISGFLKDRYRRLLANMNVKNHSFFAGNFCMITDTLSLHITMNKISEFEQYKIFKIKENLDNRIKRISKLFNLEENDIKILPSQHLSIATNEKESDNQISTRHENLEIVGMWDKETVNYANPVISCFYKIFCNVENYFK